MIPVDRNLNQIYNCHLSFPQSACDPIFWPYAAAEAGVYTA